MRLPCRVCGKDVCPDCFDADLYYARNQVYCADCLKYREIFEVRLELITDNADTDVGGIRKNERLARQKVLKEWKEYEKNNKN